MYDARTLKTTIDLSRPDLVGCPVIGCTQYVERQRKVFRRQDEFYCDKHRIYISPTTFEYHEKKDNILWNDYEDISLLHAIEAAKRESRMARDNSEDALTWNVFRYLEKAEQLKSILFHITKTEHHDCELIYWTYSSREAQVYSELRKARKEFGEHPQQGSEPDLIVSTDKAIVFIEAKLTATNETLPTDPKNKKSYLTGGEGWHREVLSSEFEEVAVNARKYELFRLWLLGSWMAHQTKRGFYLINLVPSEREKDIVYKFSPHIRLDNNRQFNRLTWEDIYEFVSQSGIDDSASAVLMAYMKNKTVGYNRFGELQKAFSL